VLRNEGLFSPGGWPTEWVHDADSQCLFQHSAELAFFCFCLYSVAYILGCVVAAYWRGVGLGVGWVT